MVSLNPDHKYYLWDDLPFSVIAEKDVRTAQQLSIAANLAPS